MGTIMEYLPNLGELSNHFRGCKTLCISINLYTFLS
jgi:hypothetical protein